MSTSRTENRIEWANGWASAIGQVFQAIMSTELREAETRRRTGRSHPATADTRAAIREAIGDLDFEAKIQRGRWVHRRGK